MNILSLFTEKIKQNFLSYVSGLIQLKGKKTISQIAQFLGIGRDRLYRFLSNNKLLISLFPECMLSMVKFFEKEKKGYLIIDDTTMSKLYTKLLAGVYDLYNTALKRYDRGLSLVVIAWTNGIITIPLKFEWLFSKKLVHTKNYKTKSSIAIDLLKYCMKKIDFEYLLIDGHYTTIELISFLNSQGIYFSGKIAKNRKIKFESMDPIQLQFHPELKLLRNERSKSIEASIRGIKLRFSVHKRKNKNNEYTYVYIVSNMKLDSKEYMKTYSERWEIEKMFRTLKQSMGFANCYSTKIENQKMHIYSIFFSYAFLQNVKYEKNLRNPEEAQKYLSKEKPLSIKASIIAFTQNFDYFA